MNDIAKAFRSNTYASVKALIDQEDFIMELFELIADNYDIDEMMKEDQEDNTGDNPEEPEDMNDNDDEHRRQYERDVL